MKMINIFDNFKTLTPDELILIEGGSLDSSFGDDIGYAIGWLISALGKGASKVRG